MPEVTIIYGVETKIVQAEEGALLGDVIAQSTLPLEQPCAGRGTCGKCKVLVEIGTAPPDDIEIINLSQGEIALNNRLACRARIQGETRIVLSPIVVYSNKIFKGSSRYKKDPTIPLGLAIDLGSTTVAAFLTSLDNGEVAAGSGCLNQQTVYGSDVISRLAAALDDPQNKNRLHRLALASINQAVDSLNLSSKVWDRIQRVIIVGNVAMHHLLTKQPLENLAYIPFQPHDSKSIPDATVYMEGIFPESVKVSMPALIGGFVGSDALACLAYFGFDNPCGPLAAIDLGTNGEVMITDGTQILTASTAAGPAFEGVNISCGSRAVDGAITKLTREDGEIILTTIADAPPVGLTGSGLLSAIAVFRRAGIIDKSGRINPDQRSELSANLISENDNGVKQIHLKQDTNLYLTQTDIRELQKAKGAIRAAVDVLMDQLKLTPEDLERVVLTGSFGGEVDIDSILELGMIPPVKKEIVETIANGAGFGAAMFLTDEGFALGEKLAERASQVDLDQDAQFYDFYIEGMKLAP
ncbi:MAG: ASKHA domain-containing protein [Anaerolineales bacterium]|nr:ASKHA domain-containing protein [Anaerolineales bacterium]